MFHPPLHLAPVLVLIRIVLELQVFVEIGLGDYLTSSREGSLVDATACWILRATSATTCKLVNKIVHC